MDEHLARNEASFIAICHKLDGLTLPGIFGLHEAGLSRWRGVCNWVASGRSRSRPRIQLWLRAGEPDAIHQSQKIRLIPILNR